MQFEAIMLQEQKAVGVSAPHAEPAVTDLASAAAEVPAKAQQDPNSAQQAPVDDLMQQIQDMLASSANEQLELASTDEVLDLFQDYFEADIHDARDKHVKKSAINTDLDPILKSGLQEPSIF